MKNRASAAQFINSQLNHPEKKINAYGFWHYGRMELIELMDFIYESQPEGIYEKIKGKNE